MSRSPLARERAFRRAQPWVLRRAYSLAFRRVRSRAFPAVTAVRASPAGSVSPAVQLRFRRGLRRAMRLLFRRLRIVRGRGVAVGVAGVSTGGLAPVAYVGFSRSRRSCGGRDRRDRRRRRGRALRLRRRRPYEPPRSRQQRLRPRARGGPRCAWRFLAQRCPGGHDGPAPSFSSSSSSSSPCARRFVGAGRGSSRWRSVARRGRATSFVLSWGTDEVDIPRDSVRWYSSFFAGPSHGNASLSEIGAGSRCRGRHRGSEMGAGSSLPGMASLSEMGEASSPSSSSRDVVSSSSTVSGVLLAAPLGVACLRLYGRPFGLGLGRWALSSPAAPTEAIGGGGRAATEPAARTEAVTGRRRTARSTGAPAW